VGPGKPGVNTNPNQFTTNEGKNVGDTRGETKKNISKKTEKRI